MSGASVLTDAVVARARVRVGTEMSLRDALVAGLSLRVRDTGAKTWVFRHSVDGKQRRVVLGAAEALTVAEARAAAAAILLGHATGAPEPSAPPAPTLARFAADYRARKAAVWKPGTLRLFDLAMRKHLLPAFGSRPLNRITSEEVARWFHDISRVSCCRFRGRPVKPVWPVSRSPLG